MYNVNSCTHWVPISSNRNPKSYFIYQVNSTDYFNNPLKRVMTDWEGGRLHWLAILDETKVLKLTVQCREKLKANPADEPSLETVDFNLAF